MKNEGMNKVSRQKEKHTVTMKMKTPEKKKIMMMKMKASVERVVNWMVTSVLKLDPVKYMITMISTSKAWMVRPG